MLECRREQEGYKLLKVGRYAARPSLRIVGEKYARALHLSAQFAFVPPVHSFVQALHRNRSREKIAERRGLDPNLQLEPPSGARCNRPPLDPPQAPPKP